MTDYANKANDFMQKAKKKLNVRALFSSPHRARGARCSFFLSLPQEWVFVRK